jgi:hypothetical protein
VAATWVPASFDVDGFGDDGYAVAWVDLDAGPRVQVFVADAAPEPDVRGSVGLLELNGIALPVFRADPS